MISSITHTFISYIHRSIYSLLIKIMKTLV